MADNNEFYRLDLVLGMQDKLTSQLAKVDSKVKKVEENVKRTEKAFRHLGNARAEPKVTADTGTAERQFDRIEKRLQALDRKIGKPKIDAEDKTRGKTMQVENRLRSLTSKAWKVTLTLKDGVSNKLAGLKNSLASPIGMMGMGAATMGIGGFLVDSAQKAMDFSYQISNIKALTNMGDAELEQVRKKALDLGAATQFSSIEAAQGMTELLKAGMSVEEVMNGATDAALNLAAAGELSLPEAAEIMSTAMNAFKVTDAAHAADILAGAANASATDVHELKYALSAVSSVAAGVGMSFDDTNTALAVFAQNGLKGSDAGTSLKTMLMRLEPTTKSQMDAFQQLGLITEQGTSAFYDAEGHMKSLADIAGLLHDRMKDLNPEQQQSLLNDMFGSDAIQGGMIMLKEGAEGVRKMQEEMTKYTASDVAKTKWENAKGDIVRLQSAFQNFQITALAPLEPAIGKVAQALTDFFSGSAEGAATQMGKLNDRIVNFIDGLAGDEKFQKMEWGDKVVYVLDKMMDAISDWVDGPGGAQFGKVMTKLAEIGMRAFLAALIGLFKGSLKALFSGNFAGAAGLALGGMMLGGGTILGGLFKGGKALGKLAMGGKRGQAIYEDARALAAESGRGSIMSRIDAARFTAEVSPVGKAIGRLMETTVGKSIGKVAGFASKRLLTPLGVLSDANELYQSGNKARTAGSIAGHWGGMILGAKAGAAAGGAIGAAFGGVGAAPGAAIGGAVGGLAGAIGGDKVGTAIGGALGNIDLGAIKQKLAAAFDFSGLSAKVSAGLSSAGTAIQSGVQAAGEAAAGLGDKLAAAKDVAVGKIGDMRSAIGERFAAIRETAGEKFSGMKEAASEKLTELGQAAGERLEALKSSAGEAFSAAGQGISDFFSHLPENAGFAVGYTVETLRELPGKAEEALSGFVEAAQGKFTDLVTAVETGFPQLIESVSTWAEQTATSIKDGIVNGLQNAAESISQFATEASTYFSDLATGAEEYLFQLGTEIYTSVSEGVANAIMSASEFVTGLEAAFSEAVAGAEAYLSALPGVVAAWLEETAATAGMIAAGIILAVVQWFEQLPGLVSAKMSEMFAAVTSWCINIVGSIRSWFSQIPGIIGGYFDSAIQTIRSKIASAWNYVKSAGANIGARFNIGYNAGAAAARSANGGVINSPLLTWVAEAGYPEVIIPTDPAKRARGLSLWQEAGDLLGVQPSTDTGKPIPSGDASFTQQIAEFVKGSNLFSSVSNLRPAFAGAGTGSGTGSAGSESRSGDSYTFSGVSVQIGSNLNEEEMALAIGRRFLAEIKQSFQNRG